MKGQIWLQWQLPWNQLWNVVWSLNESFQGTSFGHVFLKAC
jgi:hypothetical protein